MLNADRIAREILQKAHAVTHAAEAGNDSAIEFQLVDMLRTCLSNVLLVSFHQGVLQGHYHDTDAANEMLGRLSGEPRARVTQVLRFLKDVK